MSLNLAARSPEERAKVNVYLPLIPSEPERQQPEILREYFRERLLHYRNLALQYPRGTVPFYQKVSSYDF